MSRFVFLIRSSLLLGLLFAAVLSAGAQTVRSSDPLNGVSRGSLRSILAPRQDPKLSSRAAGVVEKLHVPEGSMVSAGDPLISLDSQQEVAEVAQAQATLRAIEAEHERATLELTRAEALFRDKILADKQYEEYRSNAVVVKNRRDQAKAALDLAQARLDNRTLRSPIAGIYLKTSKSIGEAVERFETIASVVDVSALSLVVYCDASHLGLFTAGQTVSVQVLDLNDQNVTVPGTVQHVDPVIDAAFGTFRVVVEVKPTATVVAGLPGILIAPKLAQAGVPSAVERR
ncbi:MAG: efflux RND transporter periplasmic adaptor subunit [Opitutaceae bacterium]|nr:efflux RND transporter periplasmic adaptor subunit [Opitutaceae bacterium]